MYGFFLFFPPPPSFIFPSLLLFYHNFVPAATPFSGSFLLFLYCFSSVVYILFALVVFLSLFPLLLFQHNYFSFTFLFSFSQPLLLVLFVRFCVLFSSFYFPFSYLATIFFSFLLLLVIPLFLALQCYKITRTQEN